jgi:hypothetical protein
VPDVNCLGRPGLVIHRWFPVVFDTAQPKRRATRMKSFDDFIVSLKCEQSGTELNHTLSA